jgi:hypothetical protein
MHIMMRPKNTVASFTQIQAPVNSTLVKQKFQASDVFLEAWNSNYVK